MFQRLLMGSLEVRSPVPYTGQKIDLRFEFGQTPVTLIRGGTMQTEGSYICDGCGEEIVVPLEPGEGHCQQYVEDCPVCCRPNVIHVEWDDEDTRVWAEPE